MIGNAAYASTCLMQSTERAAEVSRQAPKNAGELLNVARILQQ